MKHTRNTLLKDLAKPCGTREREIRREIEAAIAVSRTSSKPSAEEFWEKSPFRDKAPTAEEFIAYLAQEINAPFPEFF